MNKHKRPTHQEIVKKFGYEDMKMTPSSYYSLSSLEQARTTTDIIKSFFKENPKKLTITECCSNVGGNTVAFASTFGTVHTFELNKPEFSTLIENLENYNITNVLPEMNDYTDRMYDIRQQISFLDPPWGGRGYKQHTNLKLFLSGINIVDIAYDLLTKDLTEVVAIKAPYNYDVEELRNKLKNTELAIYHYNFMNGERLIYKIYLITNKNRKGTPSGSFNEK